ncbi:MAG: sugar phosphate isomerase/epimerase [Chthonomonas sp.]|nr:sugar phosphate isomerase/epimerase [Chthonomonas sp.]
MSHAQHLDIRIGTLVSMDRAESVIPQIIGHGFESFQLTCWQKLPTEDVSELAKRILGLVEGRAVISALGLYGNPMTDELCLSEWPRIVKLCAAFGCDTVCGFTGALEDRPVDQNLDRFVEVWGELTRMAEAEGVKIGFENCDMGGSWESPRFNIAHSPRAWEMLFNAVNSDSLGLEWEPCHQMVSFVDPIANLREWVGKVVHIHGKDATVHHDLVRKYGTRSGMYVVHHRTPGFGDTNWSDIITLLRMNGFCGAIDIEGWHDPVYREDLEMTGQVHALNYLKTCRGGAYVENPK